MSSIKHFRYLNKLLILFYIDFLFLLNLIIILNY